MQTTPNNGQRKVRKHSEQFLKIHLSEPRDLSENLKGA